MSLLKTRLTIRGDTLENWLTSNLILLPEELCVVYCGNDVIKFKIGDGHSYFTELKYVDEELITTKLLKSSGIIQGSSSNTCTNQSFAGGKFVDANGTFSVAHGIQASASHNYSFVWNGTSLENLSDRYESKGIGTFCLNPNGGIEGFYIGSDNLLTIINNSISNKVDKVTGKQLSTEDYTTAEKSKLASLNPITVDSSMSDSSTNTVQNKVIKEYVDLQIAEKVSNRIDEIMNEKYG